MSLQLPQNCNIGVYSHDAGGALILANLPKYLPNNYYFFGRGPALKLSSFAAKYKSSTPKLDACFFGTSSRSDLERKAIAECKRKGLPTYVFFDNWTKYKERLSDRKGDVLPDFLVVGDSLALKIAREEFQENQIIYFENPLFREAKMKRLTLPKYGVSRMLFASSKIEPHFYSSGKGRLKRKELFETFVHKLLTYAPEIELIEIRPHPSESLEFVKKQYQGSVIATTIKSEADDILVSLSEYSIVGGFETMPLYLASLMNRRVINARPIKYGVSPPPFSDFEQLP